MMYSANIGWNDPILVTRVSDKRFIRIWKSFQLKDKFLEELLRLGSPINWENFLCSESGVSIFSTSFCEENLEFLSLFPVGPHLNKKPRELHTAALQSSDGSGSGGGAASLPTTLQSASKQGNFRDIRHGAKCRLSCRMFSLYQDQVVAPIAIRIHSWVNLAIRQFSNFARWFWFIGMPRSQNQNLLRTDNTVAR